MKKIDEYVESIYKNFDETEQDTKILIEETKVHLYEEVEELKKEGFSENESIKMAITNFGQENIVVEEMDTVLKKQNKFSKLLIKVALVIYFVGFIFKIINIASEFFPEKETFLPMNLNANSIVDTIQKKIKDKDVLDNDVKAEITEILNDYNNRTNNGLYYIGIEKSGEYFYEYNREVFKESIKNDSTGVSSDESGWNVHRKTTDIQDYYDHAQLDEEFNNIENSLPYRLNVLSNYLFILSWILVCVSLINRAYIKDLLSRSYLAFFICPSIFILGVFATGKHTPEESMIVLTGIMILLSKFYSKNYFQNKLQVE
ncbi:permease prefix domain 1-containing protein [Clostridium sp. C2-6-12]|uniref:permease prefix domain 1-containing protein n=1 Tax=Clostridium sp. C2-6-12 TaxID=2698832 RepID=UPI00136F70E7|nr:permease prefix domain 1-containing protein [Clostridium sp. C2-6-12]